MGSEERQQPPVLCFASEYSTIYYFSKFMLTYVITNNQKVHSAPSTVRKSKSTPSSAWFT